MDRGYYSHENYKITLQKFHVIPLILKIQIQQRKVKINVKLPITFISCKIQFKKS